jgi:hypothetical protein
LLVDPAVYEGLGVDPDGGTEQSDAEDSAADGRRAQCEVPGEMP